jgi:hypothetical protein
VAQNSGPSSIPAASSPASTKRSADRTAEVTREAADRTVNMARRGVQAARRRVEAAAEVESAVAHRAAKGMTELSQAFLALLQQQTRHHLIAAAFPPADVINDGVGLSGPAP